MSNNIKLIISLIYLSLFLFVLTLHAQDGIELVHAENFRGEFIQGKRAKIWEGKVHVRQDTLELYCHQAIFFPAQGKLILNKDITIIRGQQTLTAEKVTYFSKKRLAIAEIDVNLTNPDQEMRCQYLRFYYDSEQAFAKTRLWLHDKESDAYIVAKQGDYIPQKSYFKAQGNAHFWQVGNSSKDTLHIYAQKMEYFWAPERMAIAQDSVKIVRDDLKAWCDSSIYLEEEELVKLEKKPRAQQKANTLKGDHIEVLLKNMKIHRLNVKGQAQATSSADSLSKKINRLSGQKIIAFIIEQKLQQLWAIENAQSQYYLKNEEGPQGINTASADTIQLYFKEGDLESIAVKGGSEGTYYPKNYQGKKELEY